MVKKFLAFILLLTVTHPCEAALFGQASPWKRAGTVISPNVSTDTITGNGTVPQGVIAMWSGTIATIPTGWELSDGTCAITCPDLRNRFIVAANADSGGAAKTTIAGAAAQTGGAATVTLAANQIPTLSIDVQANISSAAFGSTALASSNSTNGTTYTGAGAYTNGSQQSVSILPTFYALAYIIKD